MNDLPPKFQSGRYAELLVQLRLMEFGVQAAPPLEDSGNDLIAVGGAVFRAISVRSTRGQRYNRPKAARLYHVLAVVKFDGAVTAESASIFLLARSKVWKTVNRLSQIQDYAMSAALVKHLFSTESDAECAPSAASD